MTTTGAAAPGPDYEAFYRASKDRCLRAVVATTMDLDRAEDCTAEAFLRALQHWERVRGHPAPEAWVVRTATNVHRDRYRRRLRLQRLLPVLAVEQPPAPDELDLDDAIVAALRRLSQRQREVLALRVLLGVPARETADALGIAPGSVGTHLHRALAALRLHLPHEPAGPPPSRTTPHTFTEALP
jgi:RNA polymerase sigma factor (sigma-70 family)